MGKFNERSVWIDPNNDPNTLYKKILPLSFMLEGDRGDHFGYEKYYKELQKLIEKKEENG